MPPTGQAGGRSRHEGGERELEGLVRSVVGERESVLMRCAKTWHTKEDRGRVDGQRVDNQLD